MKTIQAYRYALDPTPVQRRQVLAHAGAARVAYNWALARVKAVLDQRAAERSYGVPEGQLTEGLSWSLPALRKAWNAAKAQAAPWWPEVSKEAFNTGLDALARGLKNFSDSRTGKRAGRPDRRTGRRPSNRWQRAAARLARAHARVANLRRDGLHKLTSRLTREVADVGFAEIRRKLAYKAEWNGGRLLVADRWYPSSKTCSGCGTVKAKLAMSERAYECHACGLVQDVEPTGRPTRGQVAAKRQPGTAPADQTGTVPPQGETTDRALTRAH